MNRAAFLVLPLLAGCSASDLLYGAAPIRRSDWFETGEVRQPKDDIARTVRQLISRQGYADSEFDGNLRLETPWDTHPSPRFREGYRTKLEVELVAVGSTGYNVRVRSTMEINNSDHALEMPDWIGAGASEKHKAHIGDEAMKLHSLLKVRFFGWNP